MKAVGVRELKAQLSRFLRDVADGETVLVTDRGRVVAELHAPGVPAAPESALDRALRRLEARAPLSIGEPQDPSVYRASPVRVAPGTARALLDEGRADR